MKNDIAFLSMAIFLVSTLLSLSACGGEESVMQQLSKQNVSVDEKLNKFDLHNDTQLLQDAYTSISSMPFDKGSQEWEQTYCGIIKTTLKVLEKCYEARDQEYSITNHPPFYTQVCPPLGGGQIMVSGMDPKDVKDPEVRKQYEEAIAGNNCRRAKHRRERALQKILDHGILNIQKRIEALPSDAKKGNSGINIIKSTVKNEKLREEILQKFEKRKESDKGKKEEE